MANIIPLEESSGAQFYPQTHLKAVVDSEGNTLDEILENFEPSGSTDAVKYTPQTLTDAQKAQARTNIGAGTYSKPSGGIPASDIASGVIPSEIDTVSVTVDNNTGTPSATASVSGSTLSLAFSNLKGATGATGPQGPVGPQGVQGNTGSSVAYPYELVNNRTTDDATKGLSAAEGKRLGDDIEVLDETVNGTPSGEAEWVEMDLTQGFVVNNYINGNQNKWGSATNWGGRMFAISPGQEFIITASPNAVTNYAFLKTATVVNNTVPDYASGSSFSGDIAAGESTSELTAPIDAHYLYVLTKTGSATENEVEIQTLVEAPKINGLVQDVEDLANDVEDIKEHISTPEYGFPDAGLGNCSKDSYFIDGSTLKWGTALNWGCKFLPVTPEKVYKVVSGSEGVTNYAFMTSTDHTNKQPVSTFASGCTLSPDQAAGAESDELIAPSDAQFLYVLVQTGQSTMNSVQVKVKEISGYEYIDFAEKFAEINEAIDSAMSTGFAMRVCEGDTTNGNVFHDLQSAVDACQDGVLTTINIDGDLHIGSTVTIPSTKKIRLIGGGLKGSIFSPAVRRKDSNGVAKIYIGSLKPQWIEVDGVVRYPASSKRAYPHKSSFTCTGAKNSDVTITFTIPTSDAAKLSSAGYSNTWVTILNKWMAHKFRIDSVNTSNGTITCSYYNGNQSYHAITGYNRIIIENINIESASINNDADTWGVGTFYYADGYLFYKYSPTDPAPNIEIPNIETMITSNGYLAMQDVTVSMTAHDFDNLMGEGEGHGYRSFQSGFVINGAIDIGGSADIRSCIFTHTTNNAIRVLNTAQDVAIDNCTFEELGADAVLVGVSNYIEYNKGTMANYVPSSIPHNVNIIGNSIHHPGRVYQEASAIAMAYAIGFYIGQNVISDTYYTGISTGLDWHSTSIQLNSGGIVEGNLLKNISVGYCALSDGSAFYNLGNERNLIVRKNIITEVYGGDPSGHNIYSLYFDEGSLNVVAENNLIYDTFALLFFNVTGGGQGISVENNIFALPKKVLTAQNYNHANTVSKNIFAWDGSKTSNQVITGSYVGNLYYRYDGTATASFDLSAVIGDPGFRDVDNYDFDIVDETNTSQIDFEPFSLKGPSMELIMRAKNSPEDEAELEEWKTRWKNGTL